MYMKISVNLCLFCSETCDNPSYSRKNDGEYCLISTIIILVGKI